VIGAGASGLTAAHELTGLGHRVVVLDSAPAVGGKSATLTVDGRPYDLGAHLCTSRYTELAALARRFGMETEDTVPVVTPAVPGRDGGATGGTFFDPEIRLRYERLRAEHFADIAAPGLAHSGRALAGPVPSWLRRHDLTAMAGTFASGFMSSGYGFPSGGQIPALYFVKYAELTGLLDTRPHATDHPGTFTLKEGFGELWARIAASLPDVRTAVRIEAIERDGQGVTVHTSSGQVRTDVLLITVALDRLTDVLDMTDQEKDIAARIRTVDYRTVVCRARGLPGNAFHLLPRPDDKAPPFPSGLVAHHHRHPGQDVHTLYCYGAESGQDTARLEDRLRTDVARRGGRLTEIIDIVDWHFMPHFGSADLAHGVLDRFEALQGANRTYHLGSLLAFELVETNVAYARDRVRHWFAPQEPGGAAAAAQPGGDGPAGRRTAAEIETWLIRYLAGTLETEPSAIHPQTDLDELGMDSATVAETQYHLSQWLGYRVAPSLFYEFTTVRAIADRLSGQ
jgi:acyl carrier protein